LTAQLLQSAAPEAHERVSALVLVVAISWVVIWSTLWCYLAVADRQWPQYRNALLILEFRMSLSSLIFPRGSQQASSSPDTNLRAYSGWEAGLSMSHRGDRQLSHGLE